MLVLSRKLNEEIVLGDEIRVKVLKVNGNKVTLGIGAPDDVRILRCEIADAQQAVPAKAESSRQAAGTVSKLYQHR